MTSIISATPYNLYPDAAYEQFKEAYAKFYGLSPEQIIAGNGSDELIQKLMLIPRFLSCVIKHMRHK